MVRELAEELGARVEWHPGGESTLMKALGHFELDLVIGGITPQTPWQGQVGLTRPQSTGAEGDRVFAVPPGENGWIVHLDRWIHRRRSRQAAAG
jgi:hypothetical protein